MDKKKHDEPLDVVAVLRELEPEEAISLVQEKGIQKEEVRRVRLDLAKKEYVDPLLALGLEKKQLAAILERLAAGEAVSTDSVHHEEARYAFDSLLLGLGLRYRCDALQNGDGGFLAHSFQCEALADLATLLTKKSMGPSLPPPETDDDDDGPVPRSQTMPLVPTVKTTVDSSWTKTPLPQSEREQWMLTPPTDLDFTQRSTVPEAKSRFLSKHTTTSGNYQLLKKKEKAPAPSLLDLHLKKRKANSESTSQQAKRGWNRDRDMSSGSRKIDAAGLTDFVQKAKEDLHNSRFHSSGHSK